MASVRPGAARRAPGMIRAAVPRMRIILAPRKRGREKKPLSPPVYGGRPGGGQSPGRPEANERRPPGGGLPRVTHARFREAAVR